MAISYDNVYSYFIESAPQLARINRRSVVALAIFIDTTARAKHGSIIMRKSDFGGQMHGYNITRSLEYVANELNLPFGQEIARMAIMLVFSMYNSSRAINDLLRSRKLEGKLTGKSEYMLDYRRPTTGPWNNVGIPDFTDPIRQAVTYVTLSRFDRILPDLKQIVSDYLWVAPNRDLDVYSSLYDAIHESPFVRWRLVTFPRDSTNPCAEDILIRLRAERPDILANCGREIDEFLMPNHYPSYKKPKTIAKRWGLIDGTKARVLK